MNLKILQINTNQAQHDLDREAEKVSALSSKELHKYEDFTDEDLVCKPGLVEQAKFQYSPSGEIFNKELEKEDKREGGLKMLKNIESKNKEQLKAIE